MGIKPLALMYNIVQFDGYHEYDEETEIIAVSSLEIQQLSIYPRVLEEPSPI